MLEYNIHNQADVERRRDSWFTAFGLQAADNMAPSLYITKQAHASIVEAKPYQVIEEETQAYYDGTTSRQAEADISSIRIAQILETDTFTLSIGNLRAIHHRIFSEIPGFKFPSGEFREVNLSKPEPVLDGKSVIYSDFRDISATLEYDFEQEKHKDFSGLSQQQIAHHIVDFASNLWQVHPFREGNTRTTAVFMTQYLRASGFEIDNTPFYEGSKDFRDCLAQANASTLSNKRNKQPLYDFVDKILFKEPNLSKSQPDIDF